MRNLGLGIYLNRKKAGPASNIQAAMPGALLYLTSDPGTDDDFQVAFTDIGGLNTTYTVAISIDGTGILTYNNITGVTGSGTNTTSMAAQTEALIEGKTITVSGLTDEWATITWSITGDQDANVASGTFEVHALPDLETTGIDETVLDGTDIFPALTAALSGSAAAVTHSSTLYDRPVIYNLSFTDNTNGTFNIDLTIDKEYSDGAPSAGTIYYVVTTDATARTDESGAAETQIDHVINGLNLAGNSTGNVADGSQAFTVDTSPEAIEISSIPSNSGTFNVLIVAQLTQTDGTENVKGYLETGAIVVTGSLSVSVGSLMFLGPATITKGA